eukprot:3142200-Rhodomonas_salina.1
MLWQYRTLRSSICYVSTGQRIAPYTIPVRHTGVERRAIAYLIATRTGTSIRDLSTAYRIARA